MPSRRDFLRAATVAVTPFGHGSLSEAPQRSEGRSATKERVLECSWGDHVSLNKGVLQMDTPERIHEAFAICKEGGYNQLMFRVDDFKHEFYMELTPIMADWPPAYAKYTEKGRQTTEEAVKNNWLKVAVDAAHQNQLKIYVWITIFDEGTPAQVMYKTSEEAVKDWEYVPGAPQRFPWCSKFTLLHPEYLTIDRSEQHLHYGVLEYSYPEVREYMLGIIKRFVDGWDFDGVFLSTRAHSIPAQYGDEFGFNEPVVKEFQRRFGVNILLENFNLEAWRQLRGEYFTEFLRTLREYTNGTGKKLSIGIPQGDYHGPPFGNMRFDWRTWVQRNLIDELYVGHISGYFIFPHRPRGYGYVQSQEDGVGLPPIATDLRDNYGPWCKKHGVRLIAWSGPYTPYNQKKVSPEDLATIDGVDGVEYPFNVLSRLAEGSHS
jgi:hypothetical protein